jgi:hypothetical protein
MAILDQKDALIHFLRNIDIEMIDLILDPDITYLNLEKSDFVKNLTRCFNRLKKSGNTFLEISVGRCKFSNNGSSSYIFTGNQSKEFIEINIEEIDGKVTGLYECYCFTSGFNCKNGSRLYIDLKKGSPF